MTISLHTCSIKLSKQASANRGISSVHFFMAILVAGTLSGVLALYFMNFSLLATVPNLQEAASCMWAATCLNPSLMRNTCSIARGYIVRAAIHDINPCPLESSHQLTGLHFTNQSSLVKRGTIFTFWTLLGLPGLPALTSNQISHPSSISLSEKPLSTTASTAQLAASAPASAAPFLALYLLRGLAASCLLFTCPSPWLALSYACSGPVLPHAALWFRSTCFLLSTAELQNKQNQFCPYRGELFTFVATL